ncbi:uncharacterized protein LOC141720795 isoform X2 [Apium graveolens]|uniref:uncharacterized protein LOC141720795 isoform X2 n=1 Tax=Apium graveolens TaxID=4045 RepID=UPI003D7B7DFD
MQKSKRFCHTANENSRQPLGDITNTPLGDITNTPGVVSFSHIMRSENSKVMDKQGVQAKFIQSCNDISNTPGVVSFGHTRRSEISKLNGEQDLRARFKRFCNDTNAKSKQPLSDVTNTPRTSSFHYVGRSDFSKRPIRCIDKQDVHAKCKRFCNDANQKSKRPLNTPSSVMTKVEPKRLQAQFDGSIQFISLN